MGFLDDVIGSALNRSGLGQSTGYDTAGQSQAQGQAQAPGQAGGSGMSSQLVKLLLAMFAARAAGGQGGLGGLGGLLGGLGNQGASAQPGGGLGGGLGGALGGGGGGGLGSILGQVLNGSGGMSGPVIAGGLGGLLQQLQQSGHGDVANSWIGNGENRQLEPAQLNDALGSDTVDELSRQTGVPHQEVLSELSRMLPHVVDGMTPQGKVPDEAQASQWI
ncbi:Uncharacterized conserved protein YidB, DUF937 family [Faunimonas pinastri]|uniref:Uncharacterized conserved protein YidB, DUF937 family n=1 Tax=Faunimonas pinastri TaxID=1855383 RepID=A0A1H9NJZ1_9HYPH|nr:YidB family protein [Faunimonas pinastri]SER36256.1 Uncharacterized conserved protein YidB, DUF937 family [Faunimonas pinastri]